ncbi:Hypothetical predicted protein [Octopus vulgaris]|uniref:Nuclear pore complex protein DDB_G0274915 n=1 Tax=Octopus vulgaris TaxID=6645 RepID=A0AA36FKR5_OCTVU|nr:Hypothetical predicted protein [Octopus vulgaris]
MTKFLNVVIAILSAGLIIQYLFGFTAFLLYCACLVSCYLFLKKTGPSQQEESLWLSTVVNFCQNFGRNIPDKCGKVVKADGSKGNLYPNLNWNNRNEKLWDNKHRPNTVSSVLAAMFGEGRTGFSLFSLFKRNNKDGGASKTPSSSDGIRNISRKRNLNKRSAAVDGDLSGSSPMARCTAYTPMSPRHHPRHRNRNTNMNTPNEQLRTNSGGKFRSPLNNSGNRTYLSSPLPRFHRTASEMQERPVISPVGFTPHALQRPEVCYPSRSVPGVLPLVNLEKKIKIPLLETNVNKLRSPVTVRIAPPETGAIHSPKFTSLKHDIPTATSPGDVLSALREGSRKRANNEEESVIMINSMNAKRRRQESNHSTASSSSSIPSLSDFLPDLALCNFSPNYMSPDTARYMSSPAVSAAMSIDESGSGGGGSSKRPAAHCVHSPNSEGSPNLKRSRYRSKNNPILSSLSSSHRYMKRQKEIRKRKLSDSADDGSFQHLRQSKENYEDISELETEKPLGKVMKPSLDISGKEDSLVDTSSEKLPEHTPQLSYANVYATKQDYENDRKAEQERVEKMLDSIANDKASNTDKDLMIAKTGIEISKNLISTTKSLETSTSKSSTDVSQTTATTSGSLSLSSPSSLLSSAAAAATTTTSTTAAWSVTASLSPKSIATTTTLTSSPSSSEQPTRLTSNTTSVNSMITPLPSLSTSAYPKASDAKLTAPSSSPSSLPSSSSSPVSQIQMKSNFQFNSKVTSPSSSTTAAAAAQPNVSVTAPQLSTTCTTVSSSSLPGTSSNSGFQFILVSSSPNATTAPTGSFPAHISSPFSATSTSLSVPPVSPASSPLSTTLATTTTDAIKSPSSSTSAPSTAGFSVSPKTSFAFPTAAGNPFGAGTSIMSSAATTPTAAQKVDATNASPASFPSFKPDASASTGPNVISTTATSTSGLFVFGNTPANQNEPTSNTATASSAAFGAPNTTPAKFVFNASSNTTTITSTTTTATTTTAAFGGFSLPFGTSSSTAAPVFGASTSTTAPVFGAATSTAAPVFGAVTSTTAPVFGASTSTAAPVFGAATSTTAPVFGASTSTAAPVFGASTSATAPVFGASTSSTAPVFGASTSTTTPVFGASSSTATPVFGASTSTTTPVFGASTSTTTPVFGASTSAAPSIFGASTSTAAPVFGAASSTTTPVFGSSTTSAPIFGTSTTKASQVFGASSSAAAPIFGSPSTATSSGLGTSTSSIFGASTSLPAPVFRVPSSTVSSIFGASSTTTATPAATNTTATTAAGAPSSNSIFKVPQTAAAASPIFGGSSIASTAAVFAAPATALNIFSTPTATASSAFGAPSMAASTKTLASTTKPAAAAIFSNPSTFGSFKDASQTGQAQAAAPSATTNVFGSSTSSPSAGFNFALNNSTSKPASSIFGSANAQSPAPAVIFGSSGQQQQQQQQQQKPDQKFNFTLNSNSGSQVPFGNQPTPFRSGFESKPSIFSGQPGAAESTAVKPPAIFGQVPITTAATGPAASMAKPLFGPLSTPGFAATPNAQSGGNPAMFGGQAATATATTKPADGANAQNTKIFTFGKTPSTQSGTSQGYDFSASMAGTSQFNFGQSVAMFNVGSGSTAPKMRSNNKARRRGGKK